MSSIAIAIAIAVAIAVAVTVPITRTAGAGVAATGSNADFATNRSQLGAPCQDVEKTRLPAPTRPEDSDQLTGVCIAADTVDNAKPLLFGVWGIGFGDRGKSKGGSGSG